MSTVVTDPDAELSLQIGFADSMPKRRRRLPALTHGWSATAVALLVLDSFPDVLITKALRSDSLLSGQLFFLASPRLLFLATAPVRSSRPSELASGVPSAARREPAITSTRVSPVKWLRYRNGLRP